jgi:N-acetylmuramoyl-L-alanine amidase
MSYLIALDDGHGATTAGKRTPNIPGIGVIKENTFNRAVVNHLHVELKRCGFQTLLVAPTDADTPLATRTAIANRNKADAYISVHYNAGGGSGIETFYYPGSGQGQKLANAVHKYVIQGTAQKNRGVKTGNLHVVRETTMPACLIEYGFMDDPGLVEARRMIDPKFQKECAVETAKGICEYFGVKYIAETPAKPADMYDLSYLKGTELIGVISSVRPELIKDKIAWAMGARANYVLLVKRGANLKQLQQALNEMFQEK